MQYFDQYPAVLEGEKETKLGEEPYIHPSCRIRDSKIGAWTALGANTFLVESSFGDYSYTAGNVQIIYSEVGKYCSIANSVRINPGNHPQWRVTQHHMTYRRKHYGLGAEDDGEFFQWRRDHRCVIGHDVWIGHGAVIMPGVEIGTGAVIGSGAVVTKNIGPYEVAVGVAAKVIKKRFDDATIEKLLASEWWNWDRPTLEARFDELLDLGKFLASPFSKPGLSAKPDPTLKPESTSKPDPTSRPNLSSKPDLSSKPGSSISPASKPSGSSASKPSGPVNDDGSPDAPLKDIATV